MSKFEFIMMFISVVVAFAMAELLVGWGKLIRARERISRPGLMAGWSVWLLFIMTYHYLGFWEYSSYDFVRVGPMILVLSAPIMLVLVTFAFTPEIRHFQRLDLEEHYFRNKNWFFFGVLAFLILSQAGDSLLVGYLDNWIWRSWGSILIGLTIIWLPFTDRRGLHYLIMTVNLLYILVVATTLPAPGL